MSTLRTTQIIHGSSAISNIVLDNQGRAIFGPDSPQGRAALYVNAQTNRVGVNTESPAVALDVDGAINATGNATIGGTLNLSGDVTVGSTALFVDASDKSVGIGTSSISTGSALTIAGKGLAITGQNQAHGINSLRLGEEPGGLGEIRCYGSGSDKGSLRFRMSTIDGLSNSDIIIDSDGQLGINTSTITNVKLQINGPLSSTSGTGLLGFGSASTPLFAVRLDDPNADLHIDRSYAGFQATPVVVINRQYGNVGLNTLPNTSVGYALAVSSTTNTRVTVLPPSDDLFGQLILGDDDKYIIGYGITHPGQPNELTLKNINTTGKLTFRCGGDNERLRITEDGDLGINTDDPSKYSGYRTLTINGTGTRGGVIDFKTNDIRYGQISNTTGTFNIQSGQGVPITFSAGAGTLMGIQANNQIFIGRTAPVGDETLAVQNTTGKCMYVFQGANSNFNCIEVRNSYATASQTAQMIRFVQSNGAQVGQITSTVSTTQYLSGSSDRRLKKNIEEWNENILQHFKTLKPSQFNYLTEEDDHLKTKGYIAQDLAEAFPEAYPSLYFEEAGEERYGYNPGGMVVYLMKAFQEAVEKIEDLETRIATLENT